MDQRLAGNLKHSYHYKLCIGNSICGLLSFFLLITNKELLFICYLHRLLLTQQTRIGTLFQYSHHYQLYPWKKTDTCMRFCIDMNHFFVCLIQLFTQNEIDHMFRGSRRSTSLSLELVIKYQIPFRIGLKPLYCREPVYN